MKLDDRSGTPSESGANNSSASRLYIGLCHSCEARFPRPRELSGSLGCLPLRICVKSAVVAGCTKTQGACSIV